MTDRTDPSSPPGAVSPPDAASRPGPARAAPGRERRARHSTRERAGEPDVRFGTAAFVALAGAAVTWLMLVGTEAGQRLENAALRGAEFRSDAERQAALDRLSQVSLVVFGLAVVAVFVVGLLRRRGGLGSTVAATMAVGVVTAELLKEILGRPELVTGPGWLLRNSFPSGTAAVATAIAVGAFLVTPDRIRWLILPAGALFAAVTSHAIQTTGWHRLSDSIGASLLVIAVACGALAVLAHAGLVRRSSHGLVDPRVRNVLAAAALAALALGTVVLVLLLLFPLLSGPADARRVLLQTAFPLLGAGFTIVALVLFARVVEPFSLGVSPVSADAEPASVPPEGAAPATTASGPVGADAPPERAAPETDESGRRGRSES